MTDDVEVLRAMVSDLTKEYPERPTLLDHFAGLAMQSLMSWEAHRDDYRETDYPKGQETVGDWADRVATDAYVIAEAMLKERAKRLTKG